MQISVAPNPPPPRSAPEVVLVTWYASGERLPWPKPQNAQPTMQTLVKLMLRLTTNVATSPASSSRSSSAATRISSITSGRVSANSAVELGLGERSRRAAPSRSRAARAPGRSRRSVRRPEPRRGMKLQYLSLTDVEDALLHPLGVQVLRVGAEPLGQRVALRGEALADLMRAREGVLGRDVVAVGGEAAKVGRARLDEVDPPVGEVRRDLDPDVGHQAPALADQALHVVQSDVTGVGPSPAKTPTLPDARGGASLASSVACAAASAISATSWP